MLSLQLQGLVRGKILLQSPRVQSPFLTTTNVAHTKGFEKVRSWTMTALRICGYKYSLGIIRISGDLCLNLEIFGLIIITNCKLYIFICIYKYICIHTSIYTHRCMCIYIYIYSAYINIEISLLFSWKYKCPFFSRKLYMSGFVRLQNFSWDFVPKIVKCDFVLRQLIR